MNSDLEALQTLQENIKILRSEQGCPWDRDQTFETLSPLFLEEAYELCDELVKKTKAKNLREELGDVLLHIVFIAEIASENQLFSLKEVITQLNKKVIERHPHVFGTEQNKSIDNIKRNWEIIKNKTEKKEAFSGIPNTLPALKKAQKIQNSAERLGIKQSNSTECIENLETLLNELKNKDLDLNQQKVLLRSFCFNTANFVNALSFDAESLCQEENEIQKERFKKILKLAKEKEIDLHTASDEIFSALWRSL